MTPLSIYCIYIDGRSSMLFLHLCRFSHVGVVRHYKGSIEMMIV